MNKLHFFIDEVSGVLKVITDMPEEPQRLETKNFCNYVDYNIAVSLNLECYQSALKAAKMQAIKVDNENEVLRKLASINEWDDWYRREEGVRGYMEVGGIYSLEGCNIEVKEEIDPYCDPYGSHMIKKALITFSESKPMNEEKRVLVFDGNAWSKEGDVNDNAKFWKPATILRERFANDDQPIVDVRFDDGSESNGHFKRGIKSIPPLPVEDKEELRPTDPDALDVYKIDVQALRATPTDAEFRRKLYRMLKEISNPVNS